MALAETRMSLGDFLAHGDKLVKLSDAARILGYHPDTLKRKGLRGEIQLVKVSNRKWAVWGSELKRFSEGCEAAA
jgi:hypothetical protein